MRFLNPLILVIISFSAFAQNKPVLFPEPEAIQYNPGTLQLSGISIFIPKTASKEEIFAINTLKSIIHEKSGQAVKVASSAAGAVLEYSIKEKGRHIPEVSEMSGGSNRENYKLDITSNKIKIEAQTTAGLYYAIQTIRQLIHTDGKKTFLPNVHMTDQPKLAYRGIMMDFAHGGLPTVAEIKRQIDFLALWKNNQYYFYNEVSMELKGFPTVGYRSGYTQAQVKDIIAYGKERHMDVVPFLNLYGHLHELLRSEKYADLSIGNYGHELDPRKPAVNKMLKNWIKQYTDLFPSPFIHVGFDETWETKRIADDKDAKINSEELWLQQLTFVQAELKKYGKTVMAWTDMNNYYPDIMERLPKDVIPVIWEYKPDTVEINRYLNPVLKEKKPFFIQPAVSGWGHIYPEADYTYVNIALCLKAGMKNKTLGFINSVWTDPVEPFVRPSWLFMAYGSIGAWQGQVPDKQTFSKHYSEILYPEVADEMHQAFEFLAQSNMYLNKCLGKNTNGMPRGTIIESWSNPFQPYYLKNTKEHEQDFRNARKMSEEAQGMLIQALAKCNSKDTAFINSMIVTARLMTYSATRFLWAKTICDRWDESMLARKKNDFVVYDITHVCHGLLVDVMDETGELKTAYQESWLTEYMPYRMNTILSRFDVEYGLWQKLYLKVNDYRIQNAPEHVAQQSFQELFKPDF
ncbi:family 20 glycosylhydrolase [Dyadobacter luticola]|uniref:beta-N-acetylhexosaminidase n=1 Tax=Dyadobacter luticola TaxID=1979387 RepID=A0A5R9KRN7_9BACT|nr:family 20 glycosylhydrolase [Dyadobacter luticola]TLU98932.1 glycoside hydrolase [Dyadobacter luticola]